MKKHSLTVLAALITSLGTLAYAHGEKPHAEKSGPIVMEQKAWGIAGNPKSVGRTISLTMGDSMRFSPDTISVKQGETIRFVVKNRGNMLHEMVIGTKKELDEHAALMLKFPNMEHEEPYMAHVAAGKSSQIVWTFNKPGNFEFACLIAGHQQAGMMGKINVAAR